MKIMDVTYMLELFGMHEELAAFQVALYCKDVDVKSDVRYCS